MWVQLFLCFFLRIRNVEPKSRKQSLDDINLDQFLKTANYEDTVKELDVYYGIGKYLRFDFVVVVVIDNKSHTYSLDKHVYSVALILNIFYCGFHCSQTSIASLPKSNFGIVSGAIDWYWSGQCTW